MAESYDLSAAHPEAKMLRALCQPPNKQLQRTVIPNRMRAASASLHYAPAARWTAGRAAAELRR